MFRRSQDGNCPAGQPHHSITRRLAFFQAAAKGRRAKSARNAAQASPHHPRHSRHRKGALGLSLMLLGIVVGLLAIPAPPVSGAPASRALVDCPDTGNMPGVGIPGTFFQDANNATWVGGDYTLNPAFVESEGVTVVKGNLIQNNGSWFGIGVVGVGSGIVGPHDGVMLAVGGNVTVPSPGSLQVGAQMGADLINGKADIGGSATGNIYSATGAPGDIRSNLGAAALAPWASFASDLTTTSDALKALANTGTYSGGTFTVTDASASLQVFSITAAQLTAANGALDFKGLPTGPDGAPVPVVINVTGTPATLLHNYITFNGIRVDDFAGNPQGYGAAASGLLWNFPDAATLDVPGSSQVMGSIVAPRTANSTVTASTNGRFYVNGNVVRAGRGGEHHNYPWRGGYGFGCIPKDAFGTFRLNKVVDSNPPGLVPPTTTFTVLVTACRPERGGADCTPLTQSEDGVALPTNLTILADGTIVNGPVFRVGDRVTFQEAPPGNLPGVNWGNVTFTPGNTIVIGGASPGQLVTVTNHATRPVAPPATFQIHKNITPPEVAAVMPDAQFEVAFSVCRPLDPPPVAPIEACLPVLFDAQGAPLPATLTLRGDGTVVDGPTLRHGDRVTFKEVSPLPDPPTGWYWGEATITPSTIVLNGNTTPPVSVTVTNKAFLSIGVVDPTIDVSFCIEKTLIDPGNLVAAGTAFTVSFTVVDFDGNPVTTYANGDPLPASVQIVPGTPWCTPQQLHNGDWVSVTELAPAPQNDMVWGDVEIVPSSLRLDVLNPSGMTFSVTNTALDVQDPDIELPVVPIDWQIHKEVTGATGLVDQNETFTVHYNACHSHAVTNPLISVCLPDVSPVGTGTVTINAKGDIVTGLSGLHHGDRISFIEDPALPGADYTWGGVTITPSTLVLDAANPVVVEVANQANPRIVINLPRIDASFFIKKEVIGKGASLVPPNTQFRVNYKVTDLSDRPVTADVYGNALPGFLTITADGAVINGPALHHRDTVTFSEVTPPAIAGLTWGAIEIVPDTLLLSAAGPAATVTVRNTANTSTKPGEPTEPVSSPTPTGGQPTDQQPPPTAPGGKLPFTGVAATPLLVITAGLLLLGGLSLVAAAAAASRRQRWSAP